MKALFVTTMSTAFSLMASVVFAGENLPAHWKYHSEISGKQFGYTDIHITKEGVVSASTLFSNGKRFDGDHFVTRVSVYGPENKPILGFQYGAGINATGGFGSANEIRVGKTATIDSALRSKIEWVGVQHFTKDSVNDKEFWRVVGEVVEAVYKAYTADGENPQQSFKIGGLPVAYLVDINGVRKTTYTPPNEVILPKASKVTIKSVVKPDAKNLATKRVFDDIFCQNATCTKWIRK